jgi:hypothetical protein
MIKLTKDPETTDTSKTWEEYKLAFSLCTEMGSWNFLMISFLE